MASQNNHSGNDGFDLSFGVLLGLVFGFLAGVLFAPKPGKELQEDVQNIVKRLPGDVNQGLHVSKSEYARLVDRTKEGLQTHMELRHQRKAARRLAEAKHREDVEAGFEF